MDEDGEVKGVGEDYGPLLGVWGAVSDVEQGDCVIKTQIPARETQAGEGIVTLLDIESTL